MRTLAGDLVVGTTSLPSDGALAFAAAGGIAALLMVLVRYRFSTQAAAVFLATVLLVALSPLVTQGLGIDPALFVGGFLVVFTLGGLADYLYRSITGKDTGVAAFRAVAADWISRIRDRRRTLRRRLEDILGRKTFIAVLVGMPLSEFVKATVVQVLAADPIQWNLAWAHFAMVLFGLVVGIYWERVKAAAEDAGDQAEEMVDSDG